MPQHDTVGGWSRHAIAARTTTARQPAVSQKQKQKRKVEWLEGWDESKFLLLDPLEWAEFHFVILDGLISRFPLDATPEPLAGPTQSFEVLLEQNSRFRLTLRPDICPEFSLDGIFTVTQESLATPQKVEKGVVVAKSASGSPLPIQLVLQGSENIVCNTTEHKRQYSVEASAPVAGTSGTMASASDPVADSTTIDTTGPWAHRRDPARFKPEEFIDLEFRSEFPNGFKLFAQGDDERNIVFRSLATLLGPNNPFTSQKDFDTSWWEEVVNYDPPAFANLSDSDDQRTHVRKCQYIVSRAAEKRGHEIMIGVYYDDGTKYIVGQPRPQTHVVWYHIKLPANKKSFKLTWSRMKPKDTEGAMSHIAWHLLEPMEREKVLSSANLQQEKLGTTEDATSQL